jgi:Pyruvate/2-oxoacid:ferredoxin oxidoreductase delta subunit
MLTFLFVIGLLVLVALASFLMAGEKGRLRRSTVAFFRESGVHLRTLHGYIYLRWTLQYIKTLFAWTKNPNVQPGEHWLARRYHGKVLTHENARCLIQLDRPIERRNLDQIVPYPVARDLILQAPPDVVVYECACRHSHPTHCEPTQVCMIVGKPYTDFILEHHPKTSRRLTREEALRLLEEEHLRGHLHSAWFKDAMINRFYAICNCCKCCCGGIREMAQRGVPIVASSGYVAQIDMDLCALCDDCVDACPFLAITKSDGTIFHNWERCLGCGVCEVKCATGAISMVRDERKGLPLDVRMLA